MVAEETGVATLKETKYFQDISETYRQRLEKAMNTRKLKEFSLSYPKLIVDLDFFVQDGDIVATAEELLQLAHEGCPCSDESKLDTLALLALVNDIRDDELKALCQVMSDSVMLRSMSNGALEETFQGARAQHNAEGVFTFDTRFNRRSYRLLIAAIMKDRNVDICLIKKLSANCGIQYFQALYTRVLWDDAFPEEGASHPKCLFGRWKLLQEGLGKGDIDFETMEEQRFQAVLRLHRERDEVNDFVINRLKLGQTVAPSTFTVDAPGEQLSIDLPAFEMKKARRGLVMNTNDLRNFVDQFHQNHVEIDGESSLNHGTPFLAWWSSLRGNVNLLWGYSWEWQIPENSQYDISGLTLRKG